jgi:hypothetical protein
VSECMRVCVLDVNMQVRYHSRSTYKEPSSVAIVKQGVHSEDYRGCTAKASPMVY